MQEKEFRHFSRKEHLSLKENEKMRKITFIPGDGTGPDVSFSAKRCIEELKLDIEWEIKEAGVKALEKYGTPIPEDLIESIKKNKIAFKGPITTPVGSGFRSVNVALRQIFELYACVRPCKLYPGIKSPYKNVDIVIIRENTEDLYIGIEFKEGEENTKKLIENINSLQEKKISSSAISIKPISSFASERIVNFAFEYARKNKRKKVTAVHKANIMKYTDGLFLEVAREVSKKYPDIQFEDRLVDNLAMQLVKKPEEFDVLVLPNLYGDIISDLCAGLVGGLGIAPGANIGNEIAIFEPTHGSAPKYAGMDKVNPSASILSAVMMLRYIGEEEKANILENSLIEVLQEGKKLTYDLKSENPAKCSEMTEEIIKKIREKFFT
jgi:isocitrate dehydrogenase (NAD+)